MPTSNLLMAASGADIRTADSGFKAQTPSSNTIMCTCLTIDRTDIIRTEQGSTNVNVRIQHNGACLSDNKRNQHPNNRIGFQKRKCQAPTQNCSLACQQMHRHSRNKVKLQNTLMSSLHILRLACLTTGGTDIRKTFSEFQNRQCQVST